MRFFSDNAAACHPAVLDALTSANRLDTAYDGDQWSVRLDGAFSDLFETTVETLWVTTGTAANSIALAMLCPPEGAILCHRDAHIENDEAGAPAFYNGGVKLTLLDGPGAKVSPDSVKPACARVRADWLIRRWRRARSARPANRLASASMSTARASPMRLPQLALRRRISPGARVSTP